MGVPKAESAAAKLRFLNPDVVVEPYQARFIATRLVAGLDGALLDAFLQVDLQDLGFVRVAVRRRPDCADCVAQRTRRTASAVA
jgi:hypothetical protein